jgi:hypothetical protein
MVEKKFFSPEDGGSMFLRISGVEPNVYTEK